MLQNKDIIITGLQPWNFALGSNIANLTLTLSNTNRVLFINYAYDRLTLYKLRKEKKIQDFLQAGKQKKIQLEQISENLWIFTPGTILESINQISFGFLFDKLNKINGQRFAGQILQAINKLEFKDFILFTDSDFYRSQYLKEKLHPAFFIYYIRDNMIASSYYKKHGARYEADIIRKADLVVTNSEFLESYAKQYNLRSFFVGQGCDTSLFNSSRIQILPESVLKIKKQFKSVIGYVGALKNTRIDIHLIQYLATNLPEYAFVLVGPEDEIFKDSGLHNISNVIFLGTKPEKELPSYIDFFDVAINPQRINDVTVGNYPRKIDEYLIMGKPVVATKTPAMTYFTGYVYLASDENEFLSSIHTALTENNPALNNQRKLFAGSHSWENNIIEMDKVFQKVTSEIMCINENS
ncbi:MAG: glycosyltransferase [Bacteroidales bacterium]|nr:glycosyltransferase [Bacteroidales bacterium]